MMGSQDPYNDRYNQDSNSNGGHGSGSAGGIGSTSSPAASPLERGLDRPFESSLGELDLVPQRSAPLPPGSSTARSPQIHNPSTFGSPPNGSYSAGAHRSSYVAGSYRSQILPSSSSSRSGLPTDSNSPISNLYSTTSSSSGLPPLHHQSSNTSSPASSTSVPTFSSIAGSHASAPAPPRPSRQNTSGPDPNQGVGGYSSSNSGTASPATGGGGQYQGSRSHQSVSAVPQQHFGTPPMGSSPILDQSEQDSYGTPTSSQSHFVPSARERERGARGGPDGRNTFKSVFGGFVNSMSGELHVL